MLNKPVESFIWRIPAFARPEKDGISYRLISNTIKPKSILKGKTVFLVDSRTIGYSEVLAALVAKYAIGDIIGKPSSGSLGESIPIIVFNSINMSITGLKVFDGNSDITFLPVKPSKQATVKADENNVSIIDDSILNYAIEVIK
jgi:hypothetical protein